MAHPSALSRTSTEDLTRLLRALHRGHLASPVTRSALIASGFGAVEEFLEAIVGQPTSAARVIVAAVLGERANRRDAHPVNLQLCAAPAAGTFSRDTLETVQTLLGGALRSIDLVGIGLDDDRRLMRTLGSVLEGRSLQARMVLVADGEQDRARADAFVRAHFPRERPQLFVCTGRKLTARVVVVDGLRVLVTSGELTGQEDDGRIDVGVSFEDKTYASQLALEWERLIAQGVFEPL